MAYIIKKCTSAYLEAVRKFKEDIWYSSKILYDTKKDIARILMLYNISLSKLEFNLRNGLS